MLAHVLNTLFLTAHRTVVIFRVQALVMNVMLGTVFLRLTSEQATLTTSRPAIGRRHALTVDATLVTLNADVQFS